MLSKKISGELSRALNDAAFDTDSRKLKDIFTKYDRYVLTDLVPDRKRLDKILYDLALNEDAQTFAAILKTFRDDERALAAILKGFKADEKFNATPNDTPYGAQPNAGDLEKKREALRKF